MLETLSTFDGVIAFVILVLIPLLLVAFAVWLESSRSAASTGGAMQSVLAESVRTLVLAVMLTMLPPLIGAFSSILQLIYRPDGGGWVVQPDLTFIVPPILYLVAVSILVRRAWALRKWLKLTHGL